MTDKKVQNNKISNINIYQLANSQYTYVNKTGYCSKCLRELDGDCVRDMEGNLFCDNICRVEFWMENRKEEREVFMEWRLNRR